MRRRPGEPGGGRRTRAERVLAPPVHVPRTPPPRRSVASATAAGVGGDGGGLASLCRQRASLSLHLTTSPATFHQMVHARADFSWAGGRRGPGSAVAADHYGQGASTALSTPMQARLLRDEKGLVERPSCAFGCAIAVPRGGSASCLGPPRGSVLVVWVSRRGGGPTPRRASRSPAGKAAGGGAYKCRVPTGWEHGWEDPSRVDQAAWLTSSLWPARSSSRHLPALSPTRSSPPARPPARGAPGETLIAHLGRSSLYRADASGSEGLTDEDASDGSTDATLPSGSRSN